MSHFYRKNLYRLGLLKLSNFAFSTEINFNENWKLSPIIVMLSESIKLTKISPLSDGKYEFQTMWIELCFFNFTSNVIGWSCINQRKLNLRRSGDTTKPDILIKALKFKESGKSIFFSFLYKNCSNRISYTSNVQNSLN